MIDYVHQIDGKNLQNQAVLASTQVDMVTKEFLDNVPVNITLYTHFKKPSKSKHAIDLFVLFCFDSFECCKFCLIKLLEIVELLIFYPINFFWSSIQNKCSLVGFCGRSIKKFTLLIETQSYPWRIPHPQALFTPLSWMML